MNKINNIENEETRKNSETTESNFDDEGHKEVMDKIQKEKAEQKKIDEEMADKLTQTLLEDEKMPINDFIEQRRGKGVNDIEISLKLIGNGYGKEIKNSNLSEDLKKGLFKFIDNTYSKYGYKTESKNAFEKLFFQIAQTIVNEPDFAPNLFFEKIQQRLQKVEIKSPISFDFIKSTLGEKHLSFSLPYGEIMHGDWSDSQDVLNNISFYDNSFGNDCKFPMGYNPHEVFEKGKSIGLGIDKIHEKYTGEGIDIAIIDNPLAPHDDIKPLEHVKSGKQPHFHGSAVASILSGKQTGIVPSANLHYIESSSETDNKDIYDNLSKLKNKNIKVISISSNLYQGWMTEKPEEKDRISGLVKEFSEKGTWVLSGDEFIKNFGILGKKDPMGDIDDFQNYQVTWPDQRTIDRRKELLDPNYKPKDKNDEYERNFTKEFYNNEEIDIENLIFINSGDRTVADPNSPSSYRHDAIGGTSWTIPAVAGYYALACQVDSNMTPERFMQLARETAEIVNISDIPKDMNHMTQGRVPMNAKIKILNIQNLIQKIDEEKAVELTRIFLGNESYNNIAIGEYEKLLKTKPEQINIVELIEDLNKGKGFREDINKKLQSNLIDSISPDDIYREFSSGLKEMPFMAKVLSMIDFEGKKNLLEESLQKNNEIADEYFNEKELDELSNTLGEESINYVLNDENLSGLVKGWKNLETPRRLYIADKIVKNLSTKFGINAPYVTNINFGEQDLTLGSKGIINLNLSSSLFNNFHDFLIVLIHEFTHCLQDNYKTPGGENGIKKAKQYYFNGVTGDNRLDNLGKKVHDSSLLEKEAYYVQAKIKERTLKIKF